MIRKKRVLIVAAHPDDELIGCGGTIIKHKKNKDTIKVLFTFLGEDLREDKSNIDNREKKRAMDAIAVSKQMGIDKPFFLSSTKEKDIRISQSKINSNLLSVIKSFDPEIIYTHSINDIHLDHRMTFEAVHVATRPQNNLKSLKKIYSFEINSASENYFVRSKRFEPNHYVNIEKEIEKKISLLKIYKKEMLKYPHSRSLKGIKNLAAYRGNTVSLNFAEAFEIIRTIK